jgi:hypothetical protein
VQNPYQNESDHTQHPAHGQHAAHTAAYPHRAATTTNTRKTQNNEWVGEEGVQWAFRLWLTPKVLLQTVGSWSAAMCRGDPCIAGSTVLPVPASLWLRSVASAATVSLTAMSLRV